MTVAFWRKRDTFPLLFRSYLGTPELRVRFEATLLCASGKTVEVADPVSFALTSDDVGWVRRARRAGGLVGADADNLRAAIQGRSAPCADIGAE